MVHWDIDIFLIEALINMANVAFVKPLICPEAPVISSKHMSSYLWGVCAGRLIVLAVAGAALWLVGVGLRAALWFAAAPRSATAKEKRGQRRQLLRPNVVNPKNNLSRFIFGNFDQQLLRNKKIIIMKKKPNRWSKLSSLRVFKSELKDGFDPLKCRNNFRNSCSLSNVFFLLGWEPFTWTRGVQSRSLRAGVLQVFPDIPARAAADHLDQVGSNEKQEKMEKWVEHPLTWTQMSPNPPSWVICWHCRTWMSLSGWRILVYKSKLKKKK